jgi:rSAM/selenodomain-associated transferase 1
MVCKPSLGVIFRTPEYGRVKKRLASEIGDQNALSAYKLMLDATIENISLLQGIDIFGFYEGRFPEEIQRRYKFKELIAQKGEDLGERLLNAIKEIFNRGYGRIVLIGADSPDLPLAYIQEAFSRLDSFDIVIGPSDDGGYYLIGLKEPFESLFRDINWGGPSVLKETIDIIKSIGLCFYLLAEWYDIDCEERLNRWLEANGIEDKVPWVAP